MRTTVRFAAGTLAVTLSLAACRDDESPTLEAIPGVMAAAHVRQSELQPGPAMHTPAAIAAPYADDPQAIADGKRFYAWYNCSGCHFNGGGGIGPPLMDDDWIYGGEPQNLYDTIMEGRPNGMPSYGGRIPEDHTWRIIAFVRTLGPGGEQEPAAREREPRKTRLPEEAPERTGGPDGNEEPE